MIFTTAFDEYALRAFKLNSIDYLLKPIDEDELEIAVKKYINNVAEVTNKPQFGFEQIKEMLQNPFDKSFKTRLTVKIGQNLKVMTIDEIECFYR